MECFVCGGKTFSHQDVIWEQLEKDWEISKEELAYVNVQQGTCCTACGTNVRSSALAKAMLAVMGSAGPLNQAKEKARFSILEINEAGTLTPHLRTFGQHTFGAYPAVDIQALFYRDGEFDMVTHSDTLEHIEDPVLALRECRRVLRPGGALCFTVPIIVKRMTRNRKGLPPSYHGQSITDAMDYIVHTEFGADAWTYVMEAGFTRVDIHTVGYPAGIAMAAYA